MPRYYIGSMPCGKGDLAHYGRKGMKWGKNIFGADRIEGGPDWGRFGRKVAKYVIKKASDNKKNIGTNAKVRQDDYDRWRRNKAASEQRDMYNNANQRAQQTDYDKYIRNKAASEQRDMYNNANQRAQQTDYDRQRQLEEAYAARRSAIGPAGRFGEDVWNHLVDNYKQHGPGYGEPYGAVSSVVGLIDDYFNPDVGGWIGDTSRNVNNAASNVWGWLSDGYGTPELEAARQEYLSNPTDENKIRLARAQAMLYF